MFTLPEQVLTALHQLNTAGYEAYCVGGCVRDLLLGRIPGDYDICTSALPSETEQVFSGYRLIETGIRHGTVTVLIDGMPLEITTYRLESTYTDHRHPDAVCFTPSLAEDLKRRDFTVNAMAIDADSHLIDLYEGQADLKRKLIRCVGEPQERFKEDALRMLRALRFASVLDFSIDSATAAAVRTQLPLMKAISAERIFSELKKLLCGAAVERILLDYGDVICELLPELRPMLGFNQQNPHHIYDVWVHSVKVVAAVPAIPNERIAALLHDSGKPATFRTDSAGIGHFYGHAKVSSEIADRILRRLKSDNALRETVINRVIHHDTPIEATETAVRRALAKYGEQEFFALLRLQRADNLAQAPEFRGRQQQISALEALASELLSRPGCFSLKDLAVNGADVIAAGIPEGCAVGQALNSLYNRVLNGTLENDRQILLCELHIYAEDKSNG